MTFGGARRSALRCGREDRLGANAGSRFGRGEQRKCRVDGCRATGKQATIDREGVDMLKMENRVPMEGQR